MDNQTDPPEKPSDLKDNENRQTSNVLPIILSIIGAGVLLAYYFYTKNT